MLPSKKAFFLKSLLYQVIFAGDGKGLGFLVGEGGYFFADALCAGVF